MFKRILFTIAALVMIGLGVAAFYAEIHVDPKASRDSNSDNNKTMFLDQVYSDFEVRNNGDLDVLEELSYDLGSDAWHGLYQDFILKHGEKVKDLTVTRYDGGNEQPLGRGHNGLTLGVGGALGTFDYGLINDPGRRLRVV